MHVEESQYKPVLQVILSPSNWWPILNGSWVWLGAKLNHAISGFLSLMILTDNMKGFVAMEPI